MAIEEIKSPTAISAFSEEAGVVSPTSLTKGLEEWKTQSLKKVV